MAAGAPESEFETLEPWDEFMARVRDDYGGYGPEVDLEWKRRQALAAAAAEIDKDKGPGPVPVQPDNPHKYAVKGVLGPHKTIPIPYSALPSFFKHMGTRPLEVSVNVGPMTSEDREHAMKWYEERFGYKTVWQDSPHAPNDVQHPE